MIPTIADELEGQWHKLAAAMVAKYGDQRFELGDFQRCNGMTLVASHADGGRTLTLRLVTEAEGVRLADEYQRAARRKN